MRRDLVARAHLVFAEQRRDGGGRIRRRRPRSRGRRAARILARVAGAVRADRVHGRRPPPVGRRAPTAATGRRHSHDRWRRFASGLQTARGQRRPRPIARPVPLRRPVPRPRLRGPVRRARRPRPRVLGRQHVLRVRGSRVRPGHPADDPRRVA